MRRSVLCGLLAVVAPCAGAQGWIVDAEPLLTIRATRPDGMPAFGLVVGATRLPDGSVLVADAAESRLMLFSDKGVEVSRTGRKGEGPGEFGMIFWLGRCASDSVYVWDAALQRMTVVTGQGTPVRQSRFPSQGALKPNALSCSRTGVIAALGWAKTGQPNREGVARGTAPLALFDRAGQLLASLGDVPAGESTVMAGGVAPLPLGKKTLMAVSADRLFVGTSDSAAVLELNHQGGSGGSITVPASSTRPSRANKERAVEPLVAWFPPGAVRDEMRKMLLDAADPVQLPPYSALYTDPANGLWVQASHPGDSVTRLERFGRAPADRGVVTLNGTVDVFEIGTDYILGKRVDSNLEEQVVVFRIRRR